MAPRAWTSASGPTPLALDLLGGHEVRRAEDDPGLRVQRGDVEALGQAEVGDLGDTVGVQQDVGRLQVAVDDPLLVRRVDGAGQGLHQPGGVPGRQRRALEALRQAAAVHILQGEVRAAPGLADLEDLDNVGVLQPGHRLRLPPEAGQVLLPGVGARQEDLEGHDAAEGHLPRPVDHAHAAATEFFQHLIAGHRRPPVRRGHRGGAVAPRGRGRLVRAGLPQPEQEPRVGLVAGRWRPRVGGTVAGQFVQGLLAAGAGLHVGLDALGLRAGQPFGQQQRQLVPFWARAHAWFSRRSG
jgi:hypothetical protein